MKNVRILLTLAVLAAVASALPVSHYNMGPARRFAPEAGPEVNYIGFSNGWAIDTRYGAPALPAELSINPASDEPVYHIIQFRGPIERSWFRALEERGVHAFGYLPNYAVLAKLAPRDAAKLYELAMVNWVGLFQPAYKLEPGLLDRAGTQPVVIAVTPGERPEPVARLVSDLGGEVTLVDEQPNMTLVNATIGIGLLPELARLQEVTWIQGWSEPTTCNNNVQWVVQTGWRSSAPPDTSSAARSVWTHGVRGQGVILSVHDTGLNTGHNMFKDPNLSITPPGIWPTHRKVVAYKKYGTADASEGQYHGSHVNGTVAGNDSVMGGTSYYDGMSKDARLYFMDLTNGGSFVVSTNLYTCWDTIHPGRGLPDSLKPIFQASGSWRWSNSSGTYLLQEASCDQYGWEHKDFLNIFAAGNEGSGARTVGNPSLAKTILTVGATGNGTSSNAIASFSSRGPSQDNRYKPNVMAPGENLYSAQAAPSTNGYTSMSGTSMATPSTNGMVGLLRCYLQEGYYPTGAPVQGNKLRYNTAALLRSMAIVSCDPNIGSYTIPDYNVGWGRVDAESVLYFTGDTRKLILCDDTLGLATGEFKQQQFRVTSAIPLRVCLAWSDTAAAPNANPTLVNNLNLELVGPTGTTYRGNKYTSGQSTPNPTTWDSLNVEECCRVNAPDTGTWTVKVYGRNVRTAAKQWFAWALTGAVEPVTTVTHDVAARSIVAPVGDVDSGTVVTPRAVVANLGTQEETFDVRLVIGAVFADTQSVTVASGATDTVDFSSWTASPLGTYAVRCSTMLAADADPGNDRAIDTCRVIPETGVKEGTSLPTAFTLEACRPNPFSRATAVRFGLPLPARVNLGVFSVTGELVRTLANGDLAAGWHSLTWNGADNSGRSVSRGVYYLRFVTPGHSSVSKLVRTE